MAVGSVAALSAIFWCSLVSTLIHEVSPSRNLVVDLPNRGDLNAPDLGDEWLLSGLDHGSPGDRHKRALGYNISTDAVFTIEVKASQTMGLDKVDIGDSFTIEAMLDLPAVSPEDKSDLKFEIFGMNANDGVAAFHICQAHMERPTASFSEGLQAIQADPVYKDVTHSKYKNYVTKTEIVMEQLHTDTQESAEDHNKFQIQFQAVMVNLPEEVIDGQTYYITAGAEYGNEQYVWIGQLEVKTELVEHDYDLSIEFPSPPEQIQKGRSAVFTISARITEPSIDVELIAFQPLGYNDIFHFGKIGRDMGNAFACSSEDKWEDEWRATPSGLTWNRAIAKYEFLVNREAVRDVNDEVNKIKFSIPIQVLNSELVSSNIKRSVAFALKLGNKKLWSALHEIQILDYEESSETVGDPIIKGHKMVNQLTDTTLVPSGNGVIYLVEVEVPAGYCNFDVVVKAENTNNEVNAVGARIKDPGTVGYFPPVWAIQDGTVGTQVSMNWGVVHNTASTPTTVLVEVSYAITPTAPARTGVSLEATIGGQPVTFSLDFQDSPLSDTDPSPITVEAVPNSFEYAFNLAVMSIDLKVTVPSTGGMENLIFEAIPDIDLPDLDMRLCRIQFKDIGAGLPCLHHANTKSGETYSKSDVEKKFYNQGILDIMQLCPMNYDSTTDADNQFVARVAFEMPKIGTLPGGDIKVSSGLKIGDKSIWAATNVHSSGAPTNYPYNQTLFEEGTFFVSYPTITTRDKTTEVFDRGEGFFIQYLFKTRPGSNGKYTFTYSNMPPHIKICKIVITHIGENMPCQDIPPTVPTEDDNTVITYADGTDDLAHSCGESATIEFENLHNVAPEGEEVENDLAPDHNSIQFMVFLQVCSVDFVAPEGDYHLNASMTLGPTYAVEFLDPFTITTSDNPLPPYEGGITGTTITSTMGDMDVIYKRTTKLMKINVPVPQGYLGDIEVRVRNTKYSDGVHVDMCRISVLEVGKNLPCINLNQDIGDMVMSDEFTGDPDDLTYEYMSIKISALCQVQIEATEEANYITLSAGVRVRHDHELDDEIGIAVDVIPQGGLTQMISEEFLMKVEDVDPTQILYHNVELSEVDVWLDNDTHSSQLIFAEPRKAETLRYIFQVPVEKTILMEVSLMTPEEAGIAIFHVADVRFANASVGAANNGSNVLCTGPQTNLKKTFHTVISKTSRIKTMMQHDSAFIDLGYITNDGNTLTNPNYTEYDNVFGIEFDLEMSDHVYTGNTTDFMIYLAVKVGDNIIVREDTVSVLRDEAFRKTQRAKILIEANQTQEDQIFVNNDEFTIEGIIRHDESSKAEAFPLHLRVLIPNFIRFTDNQGVTYSSNYTINDTDTFEKSDMLDQENFKAFGLIFSHGFTFHDVATFKMSFTVDPNELRLVGSGLLNTTVLVAPYCAVTPFSDGASPWPQTTDTTDADEDGKVLLPCGPPAAVMVTLNTPECFDLIELIDPCQVQASSMISEDRKPFYVLDTEDKAWSPALRTGPGWDDYIEFDFLGIARINRVILGTETDLYTGARNRAPKKVLIQSSFVPNYFNDVILADVSGSSTVNMPEAILARYMRIVIVETTTSTDEVNEPLAMRNVQWLGCMPKGFVMADYLSKCHADRTLDSSNRKKYRHFAVNPQNKAVFYCDPNAVLGGMQCYYSFKGDGSKENEWVALPRHVAYIEGYSEARGRVYFRDNSGKATLSTLDGSLIELTESVPEDVTIALAVPGKGADDLGEILWPGTDYVATFDGLFQGTLPLVTWKACCIKEAP